MKSASKNPENQAILRTLAKELVNSRRAKNRIHTSKAQLNSVGMQLQEQAGGWILIVYSNLATVKIAGAMQKSTAIMQMVNRLVKLPEIQKTMADMSKEMLKAGLIEEMMEDVLETEDIEVEAEEEVDKVLMEIVGKFKKSGFKVAGDLGSVPTRQVQREEVAEDGDMKQRLQALRG